MDLQRQAGNAAVTEWITEARGELAGRAADRRARGAAAAVHGAKGTSAQREVTVQRGEEDSSPEEEFLDDLESGVAKAKEYLEYVPNALEWWNKVGGEMPAGLRSAAENLAKISTNISEGLDKFSGVVDKAKQAIQIKKWAESLYDVAQATRNLRLGDKASRDACIAAIDTLGKRSGPFVDAAKGYLKGLAVRGGLAASRAFIVLQAVTAYGQIGWALLKAGIKNVELYTARFGYDGTEMDKIREAEGTLQRPPEPNFPGTWSTAAERKAETAAIRRRMEQDEQERKRRERLAPFAAKVEEARKRVSAAKDKFDKHDFAAKRYRARREKLMYQVAREMRYGKTSLKTTFPGGGTAVEDRGVGRLWWEAFTNSGADASLDEIAGTNVDPKKEKISFEEAQFEIDNFSRMQPTCKFYNDIYAEELQRYTKKQNAALKLANEVYATEAAKPN